MNVYTISFTHNGPAERVIADTYNWPASSVEQTIQFYKQDKTLTTKTVVAEYNRHFISSIKLEY